MKNWLKSLFRSNSLKGEEKITGKLRHFDKCYCSTGLKYRNCHLGENENEGLVACKVENILTGKETIKLLKPGKKRSKRMLMKTSHTRPDLWWDDSEDGIS